MYRCGRTILGLAVLFITSHGKAQAQNETGFQFNLSTPGARSLAMGGAFIGLADDATAAYTNPAGLTNLKIGGPEAAMELRQWSFSTRYIRQARFLSPPSGQGIDTRPGVTSGSVASETSGLSFLSVGYVMPKGLTVALYHHQLANYETEFTHQGTFLFDPLQGDFRLGSPTQVRHSLRIQNTGLSAAYEIESGDADGTSQALSLGVGISYYQSERYTRGDAFAYRLPTGVPFLDRSPGGFYGLADQTEGNVVLSETTSGSDDDYGVNLGFLWKIGSRQRWSLGGVYQQGPVFESTTIKTSGHRYNEVSGEVPVPVGSLLGSPITSSLNVPDIYGLGVAYSGREGRFKATFDVRRILYSQRLSNQIPDPEFRPDFDLRDINETHLGFEYAFVQIGPDLVGTLRLGAWHEPAHEPEFVGSDPDGKILFPEGEDDLHFSGGLGLVVKEDFQIDAAVDVGDRATTASLSLVYFF